MVFEINGNSLDSIYSYDAVSIETAYDVSGEIVFDDDGGSSDYDKYSNEYQHSILLARNEWLAEYRADPTVVPIVLHTDQHGTLAKTFGQNLFKYLALAINWNECSACINLGDVCNFSESGFNVMRNTLKPIPVQKQINLIGNHDTWGEWVHDTTANPPDEDWDIIYEYFDNSNYNGFIKYGTHQTAESMIDTVHGIKYVIIGSWDYDRSLGGYSHYVISSANMDAIINALSVVDNYDIVILSHIQPYHDQLQNDGVTTWHVPVVDGKIEPLSVTGSLGSMSGWSPCYLKPLIDGRKNKTSGTVYDSYGNAHSFDFSNCTSDLLCTLHGHTHADRYNYQGGVNRSLPVVVLDALHYDYEPFYLINIDRTRERLNLWKIDNTATIYNFQIPFNQSDDTNKYLSSLTAEYSGGTVSLGTTLDELTGISVTRNYTDGSTATLLSGWTLSGTLDVGENTVTLVYSGKSATFTVTVIE